MMTSSPMKRAPSNIGSADFPTTVPDAVSIGIGPLSGGAVAALSVLNDRNELAVSAVSPAWTATLTLPCFGRFFGASARISNWPWIASAACAKSVSRLAASAGITRPSPDRVTMSVSGCGWSAAGPMYTASIVTSLSFATETASSRVPLLLPSSLPSVSSRTLPDPAVDACSAARAAPS